MTDDDPPTEHGFGQYETTRRTALKTLAAGGLAGIAFTGTAMADKPERESLQGETVYNPCTGEVMEITQGNLQYDLDFRQDGGGGFHVNGHANLQGVTAEDGDGLKYQLNGSASVNANIKPPYPATLTAILNIVVTSQGSADNLKLRLRIHFTVNANGDVTAIRLELIPECV